MTDRIKVGFIGLGRMGFPMAKNLVSRDFQVVAFDRDAQCIQEIEKAGAQGADSIEALVKSLSPQKIIWLMVPAGETVDRCIEKLTPLLNPQDILIDGGNSDTLDSKRRHATLKSKDIHYFDIGTSGGLEGAHIGASFSASGDETVFKTSVLPLLNAMGTKDALSFIPYPGMGHFIKCVHNAVEYVLMQAIAEALDAARIILRENNIEQLQMMTEEWSQDEQVGGYLLELLAHGLSKEDRFEKITDDLGGGESGSWAVREAKRLNIEAPLMNLAVAERYHQKPDMSLVSGKLNTVDEIKDALEAVMTLAYKEGFCILKAALLEDCKVADADISRMLKHISAGWSIGTIIRSNMLFQFLDENSISTRNLAIPELFSRENADRSFVRRLISYQRNLFGGHV